MSLVRYGIHDQPTRLLLTFNLPLDVARAKSLVNYRLALTTAHQQTGITSKRTISIRSVQYDAASQTVSVQPRLPLPLKWTYQLTVIGTPPGGLTTAVGDYLAGAGTGQPGTNYVATITRKSLARSN